MKKIVFFLLSRFFLLLLQREIAKSRLQNIYIKETNYGFSSENHRAR